jgi:hypothetical protein
MRANKYRPHVLLIPEDDANRQFANGFLLHDAVDENRVDIRSPAGGWTKVLEIFESEYLHLLRGSPYAHVIMLIDFDEVEDRILQFEHRIPQDVSSRVFVIGAKDEPETLKGQLKMGLEKIGFALAQDCFKGEFEVWNHSHLIHNRAELLRLVDVVKPILFQRNP